MTSSRVWQIKHVYLAWFVLHFFLLIAVSCHETFWLIARGLTNLPSTFKSCSTKLESIGGVVLGLRSAKSNPLRQASATYLGCAGIDVGYGYFAPNVSDTYRLVFDLHYRDGHSETRMLSANRAAVDLRLAGLLDQIGRTQSDAFREYMIKKLAAVIWREHPDAVTMRASLNQAIQPTPNEYERGQRETSALLYAYEFSLASNAPRRPKQ